MAKELLVVMSDGGVRSLVATAITVGQESRLPMVLLFVRDGREHPERAYRHVLEQAGRYNAQDVAVIEALYLRRSMPRGGAAGKENGALPGAGAGAGVRMALLTAAWTWAARLGATRLVWPVSCGQDVEMVGKLSEQTLLLEQMLGLDYPALPRLTMPLLDMTDAMVVGVGGQMEVPWWSAWSCLGGEEGACGKCAGCARREAAFRAAGIRAVEQVNS
ncbi:MAG: 7-cyano-7-deazaguanine synthase [Phycisphaeraceae bacterium]|nr:7-cyano-7-deazaguanine synthase [Phycisphaeraceae bacterium]